MMGGPRRPTSGHVYAAGLPLASSPTATSPTTACKRVSTIFQSFNLVPSMSVEDNVALPLTLRASSWTSGGGGLATCSSWSAWRVAPGRG